MPKKVAPRSAPTRTPASSDPYPPAATGAIQDEDSRQLDALVSQARQGDRDAFASLYERFHTPVFRYLRARVDNGPEAEDMAAEVFVEAARRVRGFEGNGAGFAGWLFTIARHDLLDRGRALRRRVVEPVAELPETEEAPDPADQVVERLDASEVREALATLTGDQQEVLLLKFAAGLSNEEAADVMQKPVGAVKSLQHRGLASLRRALEAAR